MIGPGFAAVLAAAAGGDEDAFGVLWDDLQPRLVRYFKVLGPEAAEDLASETWLAMIRTIGRFQGEEAAFRAWVFTIARHKARDWRRRAARRPVQEPPATSLAEPPGPDDPAATVLEDASTRAALALIATLPAGQARPSCSGWWPAWRSSRWPSSWTTAEHGPGPAPPWAAAAGPAARRRPGSAGPQGGVAMGAEDGWSAEIKRLPVPGSGSAGAGPGSGRAAPGRTSISPPTTMGGAGRRAAPGRREQARPGTAGTTSDQRWRQPGHRDTAPDRATQHLVQLRVSCLHIRWP
jgi:RNA polymerase sigma factor (sigma-70 family)